MLKHSIADFKLRLFALKETSCRPKEAHTLRWEQAKEDRWVLEDHKTAYKVGDTKGDAIQFDATSEMPWPAGMPKTALSHPAATRTPEKGGEMMGIGSRPLFCSRKAGK